MGQVHRFLGLSVGVVLNDMNSAQRKEAYALSLIHIYLAAHTRQKNSVLYCHIASADNCCYLIAEKSPVTGCAVRSVSYTHLDVYKRQLYYR